MLNEAVQLELLVVPLEVNTTVPAPSTLLQVKIGTPPSRSAAAALLSRVELGRVTPAGLALAAAIFLNLFSVGGDVSLLIAAMSALILLVIFGYRPGQQPPIEPSA